MSAWLTLQIESRGSGLPPAARFHVPGAGRAWAVGLRFRGRAPDPPVLSSPPPFPRQTDGRPMHGPAGPGGARLPVSLCLSLCASLSHSVCFSFFRSVSVCLSLTLSAVSRALSGSLLPVLPAASPQLRAVRRRLFRWRTDLSCGPGACQTRAVFVLTGGAQSLRVSESPPGPWRRPGCPRPGCPSPDSAMADLGLHLQARAPAQPGSRESRAFWIQDG